MVLPVYHRLRGFETGKVTSLGLSNSLNYVIYAGTMVGLG